MFPNIEAERGRLKISQEYLAQILGVSPRTFTNWMGGKTDIPATALIKMAQLFHCPVDYLLGLDPPTPRNPAA